jgi:predicted YcjX-like family ATPase
MGFCTIDKKDFIKHNNKEKIEKLVKNLIIETLPELDVENIKINK